MNGSTVYVYHADLLRHCRTRGPTLKPGFLRNGSEDSRSSTKRHATVSMLATAIVLFSRLRLNDLDNTQEKFEQAVLWLSKFWLNYFLIIPKL
jgi:hypothetical protein